MFFRFVKKMKGDKKRDNAVETELKKESNSLFLVDFYRLKL